MITGLLQLKAVKLMVTYTLRGRAVFPSVVLYQSYAWISWLPRNSCASPIVSTQKQFSFRNQSGSEIKVNFIPAYVPLLPVAIDSHNLK